MLDAGSRSSPLKAERTMLMALLLSSPGPIVTGLAVISNPTTTQIADFVRRTAELVVLFASWWIYRRLQRDSRISQGQRARLERSVQLYVGGAMVCSGLMMLVITMFRLSSGSSAGKATLGLIIAILGLLTNTLFWVRYRRMTREMPDPVIGAQEVLYRAKSSVDLFVVTALSAVAVAPASHVTRYLDLLGSGAVTCYLIWNGLRTVWRSSPKPAPAENREGGLGAS